tara:strand:- start:699 stop:1280 length:582 start_codon:yes stop_codon:yes gene_type:complete
MKIPLFPLNIIVLPYEEVPLHIFEPRYKKMIKNSIKENSPFGIVLNNSGNIDNLGCSLYVTKIIKEYKSGEYDLIATGSKRFKILEKEKQDDLWIGEIKYINEEKITNKEIIKKVQNRYLELLMKLGKNKNFENYIKIETSYEFLKGISLPIEFKKDMLSINSELERLIYVNNLFKKVLSQSIKNNNENFPTA